MRSGGQWRRDFDTRHHKRHRVIHTDSNPDPDPTPTPTPTPTPSPTPAPTPIQIIGAATVTKSKKGVTAISVGFSEALSPSSATNLGLYHVFVGVKKKRKLVYTKPLKIKNVSYNSATERVTINLAKPNKVKAEVLVDGTFEALDGALTEIDFSSFIK